jgi:hypothetical protein
MRVANEKLPASALLAAGSTAKMVSRIDMALFVPAFRPPRSRILVKSALNPGWK